MAADRGLALRAWAACGVQFQRSTPWFAGCPPGYSCATFPWALQAFYKRSEMRGRCRALSDSDFDIRALVKPRASSYARIGDPDLSLKTLAEYRDRTAQRTNQILKEDVWIDSAFE